jgi:glutamate racemase
MASYQCPHIALIDSGIGGFSVLAEIEKKLTNVSVSYFMDNLYLPYGELAQADLLSRLERIVTFLQHSSPDIIVIACNTASTQSLDFLRARFDQTFVGVVPAIKPAALMSQSGTIGLLATPATVSNAYIDDLIEDFASECIVHKYGSSELVHLAETLFWQEELPDTTAISLKVFEQVDTLVLGCTHFPLITGLIETFLPKGVNLVDSGQAIANRVDSLLADKFDHAQTTQYVKCLYSTTPLPVAKTARLAQMGFKTLSHVKL